METILFWLLLKLILTFNEFQHSQKLISQYYIFTNINLQMGNYVHMGINDGN